MITQKINLNLIPNGVMPRVNVSQYDYGSRTLEITLYNGSSLFTIPTGANVVIQGTKKDNRGFQYSNLEFSGSVVTADITQQMTVFEDEVQVELVIITGSGDNTQQLATANFILNVEPAALKSDIVVSKTDIPVIQTLPEAMAEVEAAVEGAEAWAVGTKDGVPVTSEDEQYHNNSKYYAEQASGYSDESEAWATGEINGTPVASDKPQYHNSAKYWADQASQAAGGGHTIVDENDTAYTKRTNLKFGGAGVTVSDDSAGDNTVVNIEGGNLHRADYETSPATAAHAIDDILYYNNKFYDVTSAIAIGDTLTVSSGSTVGNISERPGGMSYEVFGIPGGGSGGTVIADDNTYNALIHAKQDGTGEEVANNLSGGSDLSDYAKQEELSNLVLTGTTNTSGATIAAGTCFVLNGDFVTAKADIASGATFTLNTNYEKKSVGSILTELNSNISDLSTISITPIYSTGDASHIVDNLKQFNAAIPASMTYKFVSGTLNKSGRALVWGFTYNAATASPSYAKFFYMDNASDSAYIVRCLNGTWTVGGIDIVTV